MDGFKITGRITIIDRGTLKEITNWSKHSWPGVPF